jgi:Domain of unknown function (DUF4439)
MTPVEALQKSLAAEHAAVHLYGVLGGQASKSQNPTLFRQLDEAYDEHRASRDRLTVLINAKGKAPVAALVDYAVPGPTSTPSQIEAVARTIERRVTATYGELVENTAGPDRGWAITALDASALRELGFGIAPSTFPGLD